MCVRCAAEQRGTRGQCEEGVVVDQREHRRRGEESADTTQRNDTTAQLRHY